MGFTEYVKVERRIQKIPNYSYLLNKYFNGKSLEQRTQIENNDFLSQCNGSCIKELNGTQYCVGLSREFDCKYQCESRENDLRPCERFYENGLVFYDKLHSNCLNLDEDDILTSIKYARRENEFDEEDLIELEEVARDFDSKTVLKERIYLEKIRD